jgi:hypothetical protein
MLATDAPVLVGWAFPSDDQIDAGVAELAKIIGEDEARKPSWLRRLVLLDGEWRLLLNDCQKMEPGNAPWTQPGSMTAIPTAFRLKEGVEYLAREENSETILAKRVAEYKAWVEQQKRAEEERQRVEAENTRRLLQAQRDRVEFRHDDWHRLTQAQQMLFALAVDVEEWAPDLARAIRRVASIPRTTTGAASMLPPINKRWWGEFFNPLP